MGKTAKTRRRLSTRHFRSTPYPTPQPHRCDARTLPSEMWEQSTCSVCMEFPHNAVLLLCSSHHNGCRPYMCGTSHRHSNCLQQFKNAHTKVRYTGQNLNPNPNPNWPFGSKSKALELSCPLCRGQVKGWTVVEPARKYLNDKKRSCVHDDCSFIGTYNELKKHVKSEHPRAKPREIDPEMEEKWRALELESERRDVMSTIMSSMPRSMVFGDYVIEMSNGDVGADEDEAINEGSLPLNRNILYVLREGARLMRLQWDNVIQEGGGFDLPINGGDGVVDSTDAIVHSDRVDISRADGRNRRRRRRSRGPSPFNVS